MNLLRFDTTTVMTVNYLVLVEFRLLSMKQINPRQFVPTNADCVYLFSTINASVILKVYRPQLFGNPLTKAPEIH